MRAFSLILLVGAIAIPIAGCGGDDDSGGSSASTSSSSSGSGGGNTNTTAKSGPGGRQVINIAADPSGALKFNKSSLSAKAGKLTVVMANPSDLPHAIEIEGNGIEIKGQTVNKGGTSKASGDLKAGSYEFYCPVDSHKQAGMKGTLTVS
jgi:plastocyanin